MMAELFDEEYLRSQYNKSESRKNISAGIAIGENHAFSEVMKNMRQKGFTEEQIKLVLGDNYVEQ